MAPSPIRLFAAQAFRALTRPARSDAPVRPFRAVVALPGVLDLVSLALQMRDLGRLARIRDAYSVATDDHHRKVHDYNATVSQSKAIVTTRRAEPIYRVLAQPQRDLTHERLLIVGPRNIHEFLIAWVSGFSWRHMQGIDLYSTNPKIRTMNMEAMEFADASFDAVAMSSTLAYAKDVGACLREVARILKPGGRFSFSTPYNPDAPTWPGDWIRANDLHDLLYAAGFAVYFHHAFDKTDSQNRRMTSHNFGVVKRDPDHALLDPLHLWQARTMSETAGART